MSAVRGEREAFIEAVPAQSIKTANALYDNYRNPFEPASAKRSTHTEGKQDVLSSFLASVSYDCLSGHPSEPPFSSLCGSISPFAYSTDCSAEGTGLGIFSSPLPLLNTLLMNFEEAEAILTSPVPVPSPNDYQRQPLNCYPSVIIPSSVPRQPTPIVNAQNVGDSIGQLLFSNPERHVSSDRFCRRLERSNILSSDIRKALQRNHCSASTQAPYNFEKQRTRLTKKQRQYMMSVYEENDQNPSSEVMRQAATVVGMRFRLAQYWFQNRQAALRRKATSSE
ncbi:UNVERIFIED_CONTAM: hypothetical protein HDU68_009080 [Siphonaria sp. JEL0065]|nr:hypothetical protein HDU68_009080 [Siphonaria sp. JEL0065]